MGLPLSTMTTDDVVAYAPLCNYYHIPAYAKKTTILRGLSQLEPSPTTVTWIHYLTKHTRVGTRRSSSHWYGWWNGETSSPKVHFIATFPAYTLQYVLVGGDTRMPIEEGGDVPLSTVCGHLVTPGEITTEGTPDDEQNTESYRWWNYDHTYAVLLGKVRGDDPNTTPEVGEILARYLMLGSLPFSTTTVPTATTSLIRARTRLTEKQYRQILTTMGSYFTGLIEYIATTNDDYTPLVELLQLSGPSPRDDLLCRALLKYGGRARILLYPDFSLKCLLGLPVGSGPDNRTLHLEVCKVLDDPDEYQRRIVATNRRHLETFRVSIPWPTTSPSEERLLTFLPNDILFTECGGIVNVVSRHELGEDTSNPYNIFGLLRGVDANLKGLPTPRPAIDVLREMTSVAYYTWLVARKKGGETSPPTTGDV